MNVLLLAAEGGDSQSGLQLILPALPELIYGGLSFIIVFYVLSKVAWPRLNEVLDERRAAIQGKMEDAEQALADAERAKKDYRAQIDDARGEANRIIEDAKSTAESVRRDIVAKAESEAESIRSRAQSEVANERDRALQELRAEVGAISVELASKIVEKELDPQAHQHLVDEYINDLARNN